MMKHKRKLTILIIIAVILAIIILLGLFVYRTLTHRPIEATPRITSPAVQQALRATYEFQRFDNLPYDVEADPTDESRQLDLLVPKGPAQMPVMVIVHGGAWTSGGRKATNVQNVAEWFAQRGFIAVPLDSRLVPEVSIFDLIRDVAKGVAWVYRHVEEYGGDPQRIYLLGHSSGAHVNSMLACDRQYLNSLAVPESVPAGVIAIAGVYDLREIGKASTIIGRPAVRILVGTDEELRRQISPVVFVRAGVPPFLLLIGQGDDLIQPEQLSKMEEAVRAVGGSCTTAVIARRNHQTIFSNIPQSGDGAAEAIMWFMQ